jgi:membrane-bound lytic murein transglycosylase D
MNGLQPEDTLRAGQHLRLVSTAAAETGTGVTAVSATTVASGTAHTRKVTYIVRAGDTLVRIARVFQVTVAQLVSWNSLEQTALAPGQHLLIRVASR